MLFFFFLSVCIGVAHSNPTGGICKCNEAEKRNGDAHEIKGFEKIVIVNHLEGFYLISSKLDIVEKEGRFAYYETWVFIHFGIL